MSERSERRCDVAETLRCDKDRSATDDSGQTSEFAQSAGYDANLAQSTAHGRQTTSDFTPVVLSEFTEYFGDIIKGLHCNVNGTATDDSGQTSEFAQGAGNEPDFAQSAAHGGKTTSDLAPVIAGERPECICDITKGFGRNDHADGSGNVVLAESAEKTSDRAHLRQGTAHGR